MLIDNLLKSSNLLCTKLIAPAMPNLLPVREHYNEARADGGFGRAELNEGLPRTAGQRFPRDHTARDVALTYITCSKANSGTSCASFITEISTLQRQPLLAGDCANMRINQQFSSS